MQRVELLVRTTEESQEWLREKGHRVVKVAQLFEDGRYSASNAVLGRTVGSQYPRESFSGDPSLNCFKVVLEEYSFSTPSETTAAGEEAATSDSSQNDVFTVEFVADTQTTTKLMADLKPANVKLVIGGILDLISGQEKTESGGDPAKKLLKISPSPKVIRAVYGKAILWICEDRPAVLKAIQGEYQYTSMNDLVDGSVVNAYGVITSCEHYEPRNKPGWGIKMRIVDESVGPGLDRSRSVILKGKPTDRKPEIKAKYDIIRLHRALVNQEIRSINNRQLFGEVGSRGFHCCLFDGTHGGSLVPYSKTSEEYTMTDPDRFRISELRDWIVSNNLIPRDDEPFGIGAHKIDNQLFTNFCDLKDRTYVNIVGQVIGIYSIQSDCVAVRIWDGTRPTIPLVRLGDPDIRDICHIEDENLMQFVKDNGESSHFVDNVHKSRDVYVDVFAYDGQCQRIKEMKLRPGNFVKFINVHVYIPGGKTVGPAIKTAKQSLTLHQGGEKFGRASHRLSPTDPLTERIKMSLEKFNPPKEIRWKFQHGQNEFLSEVESEALAMVKTVTSSAVPEADIIDENIMLTQSPSGSFCTALGGSQPLSPVETEESDDDFTDVEASQPTLRLHLDLSPSKDPLVSHDQQTESENLPRSPVDILESIDRDTTPLRRPPVRSTTTSSATAALDTAEGTASSDIHIEETSSDGGGEGDEVISEDLPTTDQHEMELEEEEHSPLPIPMETESTNVPVVDNPNLVADEIKQEMVTPPPIPTKRKSEESITTRAKFISVECLSQLTLGDHVVHLKPVDYMPFIEELVEYRNLLAWWCEKCSQNWKPFGKDDGESYPPPCGICNSRIDANGVKTEMSVAFRFYLLLNPEKNVAVIVTGAAAEDFLGISLDKFLKAVRNDEIWPIQLCMKKLATAVEKGVKVPLTVSLALNDPQKRLYRCY